MSTLTNIENNIRAMWSTREFSTADIAETLAWMGVDEAFVVHVLQRGKPGVMHTPEAFDHYRRICNLIAAKEGKAA